MLNAGCSRLQRTAPDSRAFYRAPRARIFVTLLSTADILPSNHSRPLWASTRNDRVEAAGRATIGLATLDSGPHQKTYFDCTSLHLLPRRRHSGRLKPRSCIILFRDYSTTLGVATLVQAPICPSLRVALRLSGRSLSLQLPSVYTILRRPQTFSSHLSRPFFCLLDPRLPCRVDNNALIILAGQHHRKQPTIFTHSGCSGARKHHLSLQLSVATVLSTVRQLMPRGKSTDTQSCLIPTMADICLGWFARSFDFFTRPFLPTNPNIGPQ